MVFLLYGILWTWQERVLLREKQEELLWKRLHSSKFMK